MSVVPFDGANLIEYERSSIDKNHINEDIPKIFEKFSNQSDWKKGKFELSYIYRCVPWWRCEWQRTRMEKRKASWRKTENRYSFTKLAYTIESPECRRQQAIKSYRNILFVHAKTNLFQFQFEMSHEK